MNVTCPYCKQIMKKGYIYNGKDDIVWTPENEKPSALVNHPFAYQVMLSKSKRIVSNKCEAYRCPACHVVIMFEKAADE